MQENGYTSAPRNIHRRMENRGTLSEEEFLSGEEYRIEEGYITIDEVSESEGELETDSISDETGSSVNGRNEDESMLAAIIAAMGIEGTGLEQGLRQGSVEASIRRLMEAVKDAAVNRSMESGNGRNSGKKKAE